MAVKLGLPGVTEAAMLDQFQLLSPNMGNKVTPALKMALRCVRWQRVRMPPPPLPSSPPQGPHPHRPPSNPCRRLLPSVWIHAFPLACLPPTPPRQLWHRPFCPP